jgi:hypothetical protein
MPSHGGNRDINRKGWLGDECAASQPSSPKLIIEKLCTLRRSAGVSMTVKHEMADATELVDTGQVRSRVRRGA